MTSSSKAPSLLLYSLLPCCLFPLTSCPCYLMPLIPSPFPSVPATSSFVTLSPPHFQFPLSPFPCYLSTLTPFSCYHLLCNFLPLLTSSHPLFSTVLPLYIPYPKTSYFVTSFAVILPDIIPLLFPPDLLSL